MRDVKDIICELNQTDHNWEKQIIEVEDLDEIYNNSYGDLLSELLEVIRGYVKKQDKNQLQKTADIVENVKTMEGLLKCVNKMLIHYNNLSVLRGLEKDDCRMVGNLLQDIIENFVVRVDYQFFMKHNDYMIESQDEMRSILKSIDCLTEYYVRRFFTKKAIEADFLDETGLTEENCKRYSEIVDKHFSEIKMNIVMQDADYIRQAIIQK